MSTDVIILLLRLAAGGTLLVFAGSVAYMIWRDYQQAIDQVIAHERRGGRLVVLESDIPGLAVGQSWVLSPVTTLGRASSNTITLDAPFGLDEYALVTWRGGWWWLQGVNSSDVLLLNSRKLDGPALLTSGDVITLGRVQLRVELD
ncbi:MAG: FHA domain-containing protein [Chloroflexi bacterium]|nr:FHA domain-containing protein [Chloroflexota bacterium]